MFLAPFFPDPIRVSHNRTGMGTENAKSFFFGSAALIGQTKKGRPIAADSTVKACRKLQPSFNLCVLLSNRACVQLWRQLPPRADRYIQPQTGTIKGGVPVFPLHSFVDTPPLTHTHRTAATRSTSTRRGPFLTRANNAQHNKNISTRSARVVKPHRQPQHNPQTHPPPHPQHGPQEEG